MSINLRDMMVHRAEFFKEMAIEIVDALIIIYRL